MALATLLPSLIRTYVPILVGFLVGWASTIGINVTNEDRMLLVSGISSVAAAAYYALARILERKFPWATILLGSSVQPTTYSPAVMTPATGSPAVSTPTPSGNDSVSSGTPPGTTVASWPVTPPDSSTPAV